MILPKGKFLFINLLNCVLPICVCVLIYSCRSNTENQEALAKITNPIQLENFKTLLPDAEGVEYVKANCGICHSTEYINMQPALSEKAWSKTVDKMIHSFGAPVPDSASRLTIIKYLVSINRKK